MTAAPAPVRPTPSRAGRRLAALAVALVLVLAACGGDDDASTPATTAGASSTTAPATTDAPDTTATTVTEPATPAAPVAEPGTYAVGSVTDTLVDDTRVTPAQGDQPELPQRTLPLLVLYPAQGSFAEATDTPDATPEEGRWPVVVFSHGLGGSGPAYVGTLRVWASAGYVVVAPTYPLSSLETEGGGEPDDLRNQPGDVSAIIDWVRDRPDGDPLTAAIDAERIALSGHSLGGFTSLAAAYNPCCRDDRVAAVAEWAGAYVPGLTPDDGDEGGPAVDDGPPLLIVHGDADGTVPYDRAADVADQVGPPWWLVTLVGGLHIPPYVQGLGDASSTVATTATLDFFDAFLKDDADGLDRMDQVVADAGPDVATIESDEG